MKKVRLGLALGGGAARGLAHIGVLQALEDCKVPIGLIAGASMGAIIGAIYAMEPSAARLQQHFTEYLDSEAFKESRFYQLMERKNDGAGVFERLMHLAWKGLFLSLVMTRKSYFGDNLSEQNFAQLIPDVDMSQTRIPFCASALDLVSGQETVLSRGSLRRAVAASCAIPGLLPPVGEGERILVDGGWINAVPVSAARRQGASLVVGVDVSGDLPPFAGAGRALEIAGRADSITRWALGLERARAADLLLRPENEQAHWADFSQMEEAVASGRRAAEAQMADIQRLLRRQRRWAWLGR